MKITSAGKTALLRIGIVVVLVGGFFGFRYAAKRGIGATILASMKLDKITTLNTGNEQISMTGSASSFAGLPSTKVANMASSPTVRVKWWAWQAQDGCQYANGGPETTDGSLMQKAGIHMTIERNDDNPVLMGDLAALAKALHDGEKSGQTDTDKGVHFVGIMGDGAGPFLYELNKQIEKYGSDYRAEIIGSCGYSRGEDKLMGPRRWKDNPQSMRGALIAGVVRDGDWNIAIRYEADNTVPNNPDEKTFDPNAVNWVNTDSYTDASNKYNSHYKATLHLVENGKLVGRDTTLEVQGVVTWTPGDVTIAQGRGDIISVVSTKQYAFQMPHVIIGIRKWNQTHRETVEKMLQAFADGGDQVLTFPKALDRASEIANDIYKEKGWTAVDWKKYYIGTEQNGIELGGSKVNNLADNLALFGLVEGSSPGTSRFHATFTTFCPIAAKMYPKIIPACPLEDQILDLSYLKNVAQKAGTTGGKAEAVTYAATSGITDVVGRRSIAIHFVTGKSDLSSEGELDLKRLMTDLSSNALRVEVHGYTDNTGSEDVNQRLSEERALTVKNYLEGHDRMNFPNGRVTFKGHGSQNQLASNTSADGRAKNRRVEIIIGQ